MQNWPDISLPENSHKVIADMLRELDRNPDQIPEFLRFQQEREIRERRDVELGVLDYSRRDPVKGAYHIGGIENRQLMVEMIRSAFGRNMQINTETVVALLRWAYPNDVHDRSFEDLTSEERHAANVAVIEEHNRLCVLNDAYRARLKSTEGQVND